MHAMMSTGQRRYGAVRGADMVEFGTWAEGAESEARRVLSVAERTAVAHIVTGQGWACDPYTRESLHAVRKALAEALASFCAAPDPAAYLAAQVTR